MNLLSNAAKYTDPGGCIRLTAEHRHGGVMVSVRDNGVGIAADKLEHLFALFYQGDNSLERPQSGLGIGLSLARRLVELHGGSIEARSAGPGQGSEFIVRLATINAPQLAPQAALDSDDRAPEPVARRILVADDNRDAADSLGLLLQMGGNDVRIAYESHHALRLADEFRPDTALLDIGMPDMNGCDLARSLRGQAWGERMLLIAVTGWGQAEDRRRTREAGFDAHLVKPVDHAVLLRLLADPPRARADAN
jgi:CheY-like chemotaxis protein